jgi:RND family efflux transporter MFP subunit
MFNRINNFFFWCLFCFALTLLTGCSGKIGDSWKEVTTGIKTDTAKSTTTAVVSKLDNKDTEYEFRLSAVNKHEPLADTFKTVTVGTKSNEASDVDNVEFKIASMTDTSATLTWKNNAAWAYKLEARRTWKEVTTGITTDSAKGITTAVVGSEGGRGTSWLFKLDKGADYEFRLSAVSKLDPSANTFDAITIGAKPSKARDDDEIKFRVAKKSDTSATLLWDNNDAWTFKLEFRKGAPPPPPKTEVIVDSVAQDDVPLYIYTDGRTVAANSVEIRTRVSGFLKELFFQPGAIVKEGDRLALVEQDAYKIALEAAEAGLASSKAQAQLAENNLQRAKSMVESRTITTEEYQTHLANRDMALAAVALAESNVRNAKLNLQYTDMYSPLTGKTTKNLVDVDNFVSPTGAQAVILSITQLDPMFVEFKLTDRQFSELKDRLGFRDAFEEAIKTSAEERTEDDSKRPLALTGMSIDVSFDTGANVLNYDFNVSGKIVALIDNRIDPMVGQITLRAELQNPLLRVDGMEDYLIYPGRACRVRIPREMVKDAVLIREGAMLTDLDTKYVYVVGKEMYHPKDPTGKPLLGKDKMPLPPYETDVARRRDLKKIGPLLESQKRIVLSGLKPGESYIVTGVQRVRDGMEVKPTTSEEYAARRAAELGETKTPVKPDTAKEEEKE